MNDQIVLKITRKGPVNEAVEKCIQAYHTTDLVTCVQLLNEQLLQHRVKFPLLEYAAELFYKAILPEFQIIFCDLVQQLKTEGGNVILGKILQLRLHAHYNESLEKATEYTAAADIWYICDIIGERVFGVALLAYPKETLFAIEQLSNHPSHWVIRSLGAGSHYAIKKGLERPYVKQLFPILLGLANSSNKEIRQGIGWAAKTAAKFHPTLISDFQSEINNPIKVANWFRKKIEIGLNRHAYANRN